MAYSGCNSLHLHSSKVCQIKPIYSWGSVCFEECCSVISVIFFCLKICKQLPPGESLKSSSKTLLDFLGMSCHCESNNSNNPASTLVIYWTYMICQACCIYRSRMISSLPYSRKPGIKISFFPWWKNHGDTERLSNLSKIRFLEVLEAVFTFRSAWRQEIPNNCKFSLFQHVETQSIWGEKHT